MVIVVGILVAGLLVVGALGYAVHRYRERAEWARIREEQMRRLKKAEEGERRKPMSEKGTRDIKKLSPKELGEQLVKLGIKAAEKERKPCPRRNERGC